MRWHIGLRNFIESGIPLDAMRAMAVVSRAMVEYGGAASSTRATESARSSVRTRYVRP